MEGKIKIIERSRVVIGLILISLFPVSVSLAIVMTLSQFGSISLMRVLGFWFGTTILGLIILPKFEIVRKEENDLSFTEKIRNKFRRDKNSYRCKKCGEIFKTGQQLGGHQRKHFK